jgi:two-component system response regulator MprA
LSPTEFRILGRLLAHPDEVVRRQQLKSAGWPDGAIVSDNTLDQYIAKLRRRLSEIDAPASIEVARSVGYRVRRA